MKNCLILTVILVFAGVLWAAKPQTDWQKELLQGKVKIITSVYGTLVLETTTYNPQGFRESTITGDEEYFEGETRYTYDDKGRLLTAISLNSDREEIVRYTYNYDASGLLISKELKDTYGSDIDKYEYNPTTKQLSWVKTYAGDNSLLSADEYIYDTVGNNTRVNSYNETMELYSYTVSDYDKNNKLVEMREYIASDTKQPEKIHKYNAQGWLIEEDTYYKGELETRMKVSYDKYGNNTVNEVYFNKDAKTNFTTFTYTYDKKGNWLTREEFRDGKHNYKEERVITYY